jgi:hypothetical protein
LVRKKKSRSGLGVSNNGLDVSIEATHVCVVDRDGAVMH